MRDRSPYFASVVMFAIAICVSLVACCCGVCFGIVWQAFVNLALVVFDSICFGWALCKYDAYLQFIKHIKETEKAIKSFERVCEDSKGEPFKEFDNE